MLCNLSVDTKVLEELDGVEGVWDFVILDCCEREHHEGEGLKGPEAV